MRSIASDAETRAATDLAWGTTDTARIMPVLHEGDIRYVVIYKTKYLRPAV